MQHPFFFWVHATCPCNPHDLSSFFFLFCALMLFGKCVIIYACTYDLFFKIFGICWKMCHNLCVSFDLSFELYNTRQYMSPYLSYFALILVKKYLINACYSICLLDFMTHICVPRCLFHFVLYRLRNLFGHIHNSCIPRNLFFRPFRFG